MNFNVTQRRSQVSPFELVASDSLVADLLLKIKAPVKLYFLEKS